MEVALTFGAVGDFLSIALLVKDIIAALDESRGSAKAYRELIEEINRLQKTIDQIENIYKGPELSDGFQDLDAIARTTIGQIHKCLEGFCSRVSKKYGESLAEGGSGNIFKDVTRKIQWKLDEKEVEKFRSDVMGYRMSLEMFLQVTTIRLVQNNHKAISEQLKEVETNTITTVRQYGQSIENYLRFLGLCILARLQFISRLGADVKQTAGQILTMMFVMSGELNLIKAIIMQLDRGIDNGEHFVLEDATGRSFPIHLKTIISWEAFDVILRDRFKGKRGERRIRRKFYSLHESASQLEIDRSVDFVDAFVPNQKVDMSLICRASDAGLDNDGDAGSSSCPWCRTASPGRLGARVKCISCKRHFTRIVVEADDFNRAPFVPSAPKSRGQQSKLGQFTAAGNSTLWKPQHKDNDAKKEDMDDPQLVAMQESEPESESDEENISGLAHITLQTRRLRLPKESLDPDSERTAEEQDWSSTLGDAGDEISENLDNLNTGYEDITGWRDQGDTPPSTEEYLSDGNFSDNFDDEFDDDYGSDNDENMVTGRKSRSPGRHYGHLAHSTEEDYEYACDYLSRAGLGSEVKFEEFHRVSQRFRYKPRRINRRDIQRHDIIKGYSLKYWDPDEEPIYLLGNVFDARSLGKWIVDWTFYHQDEGEPARKLSGEVWLALLKLAGKIKRSATTPVNYNQSMEDWRIVQRYVSEGQDLMDSFGELLRKCEAPMLQAAEDEEGRKLGNDAAFEFVKTMFGEDRELGFTKIWLKDAKTWIDRFENTCESILQPDLPNAEWLRPLSPITEIED